MTLTSSTAPCRQGKAPLILLAAGALAFFLAELRQPALARAGEPVAPSAGMFLIAGQQMQDPRFRKSVVLITHYGAQGAKKLSEKSWYSLIRSGLEKNLKDHLEILPAPPA